jgi:hypothetical protein
MSKRLAVSGLITLLVLGDFTAAAYLWTLWGQRSFPAATATHASVHRAGGESRRVNAGAVHLVPRP